MSQISYIPKLSSSGHFVQIVQTSLIWTMVKNQLLNCEEKPALTRSFNGHTKWPQTLPKVKIRQDRYKNALINFPNKDVFWVINMVKILGQLGLIFNVNIY